MPITCDIDRKERDHPWLRALLDQRERFVGRKRGEWTIWIGEPLPVEAPRPKLDVALRVLDRLCPDQVQGKPTPREIRVVLFPEATREPERSRALARTASRLELSPGAVLERLFADLPDERVLIPLAEPRTPPQLALACNAELVASLLAAALRVRIHARGNVRAVVRHAKLVGLLCHTSPGDTKDEAVLEISGPYALFRHTRIYARALASLVPRLNWCSSYRLEADCVLQGGTSIGRLHLRSGDPIAPARELAPFDSKVEERFARSFASAGCSRSWATGPRNTFGERSSSSAMPGSSA
jgi:predicted nuclease of restriction endonuclease-like RecB superfamily